jgi:pilus assembly protein CpaC
VDESLSTQDSDRVILTQGGQTILTRNDFKTGRSGINVINLLKITGPQQVMLEVKFAEVSRKSGRDLQAGFAVRGLDKDFAGAVGTGTLPGGSAGPVADLGSLLVNLANNAANIFVKVDDFSLVLNFLEGENLARTLAEPRLVTQSGQEASFLAGGEYPYPVDNGTDGIEIAFKEFGVGLKFTPIVNSDGMITMRVAPSVTDVVSTVETAAGLQPVLSTRRTESTVQLRDGQTLAMAGLLKENMNNIVEKVPLLGDIPILGALFRSSSFREEKTDLIVAITPHLVKPVKEGEVSFPGEFIKRPNRFEFYLEGRLEGRRSPEDRSALSEHSFAVAQSVSGGGLEGQFGHTEAK